MELYVIKRTDIIIVRFKNIQVENLIVSTSYFFSLSNKTFEDG